MSVSKEIIFEEMERIEREEYDEDGNPKEAVNWEVLENIFKAKKVRKKDRRIVLNHFLKKE